ncbi:PREDICTED: uncharacterized protein LOC109146917 [Ipomoea nil]|uniref:uncharacterized protein LOC109146917 n=1 Tax=Ipomoea nil TaxID=35883 RepID=UPI000900C88B|nr:PREDICTED: uncharacterized protein LOC109146917 [Ipomoea nil]
MPMKFVWKKDIRKWSPRKRGFTIGRIFYVPPGTGEIYYLRCLLNKVRGPTSYLDIKIVDGVQHESFRDAYYARGLVEDDKENVDAIQEASQWATATSLRRLFVTLLMSNAIVRPEVVWEIVWQYLAEDAQFNLRQNLQKAGKTFLWRALSSALRSNGEIVLNVASSAIASLLLPGGRTAHSRLAIPISINEDSTCNIAPSSPLPELIVQCKLIIWDEAPMMHKYRFEALDRTMRDLLRLKNPNSSDMTFGGKTVVLGGDFRQILPVIPKGTRHDIVGASINSSYLWQSCKVFRLTKNLRLRAIQSKDEVEEIEKFTKWIANIGDGVISDSTDGEDDISIPEEFLLQSTTDPIATIVDSTFPMFRSGRSNLDYLQNRAILAPTVDLVDNINEYMNEMSNAEGRTYLSCDSA